MAAGISIDSRTIHTLHVTVPDDILGKLEHGDEVEVVMVGRGGTSTAKKLTYRDLEHLLGDPFRR